jgi:hypothetical protein
MAGQPRKQAMIAELERLASKQDQSVLEYAEEWIASGKTILALSKRIKRATREQVSRDMLSKYLNHCTPDAAARLAHARLIGGHGLLEDALAIADRTKTEDVPKARLRVQARQWAAERWSPELAPQKGVSVTLNVGSLHLDALRAIPSRVTPTAHALIAPSPDSLGGNAQVVDAEIVTESGG